MCLFCNIINRELEGYIVYEDNLASAFLDKFPVTPGHTLVVPKKHYDNYLEADEETLSQLARVTKIVALGVMEAVKADGIRILTNIGESAGQVVFHLHLHVIPTWMKEYPSMFSSFKPRREQSKEYYELLQKIIRESVDKIKRSIGDSKWV